MEAKVTIPANNEIAKCIAISANFRAYTYNLKKQLAYYRKWERTYKDNPGILFKQCLDFARIHAQDEARSFERLSNNMPEYSQHPDFIKAHNIYKIIMSLV